MDLVLTRTDRRKEGIFGVLRDTKGNRVAYTLEHAYKDSSGNWTAKIPEGKFTCKRGFHRLHGMTQDFTTFEIEGVKGHDNLLFHWGNYNKNSEGCILVGASLVGPMITNSRTTFAKFIALQDGCDEFQLTVK